MPGKLFPSLGLGLGLRTKHYEDVLNGRTRASWFEALSENYLDDGGRPLHILKKISELHPIALHGVSLSIASTDPLSREYLRRLKKLVDEVKPVLVSDHCCWTTFEKQNLHDLMPVPYTEEALNHIVERIRYVQDFLGRRILIENVSSYIEYAHSEMDEVDFLSEIALQADCGLLLDVNNVYVSSVNHGFDAAAYLDQLPAERIGQIHLAGHDRRTEEDGRVFLVDTHDHPVCPEVWQLYRHAVRRFGQVSTMVEWDADIPELPRLEEELDKARAILEEELHVEA